MPLLPACAEDGRGEESETHMICKGDIVTVENGAAYIYCRVNSQTHTFINLYTGQHWTNRKLPDDELSVEEVATIFGVEVSSITNHGKLKP